MAQERRFALPDGSLHLLGSATGPNRLATGARRIDMHPEELMRPDLLSEIVLLTFGTLLLSSLVWFVVAALARL